VADNKKAVDVLQDTDRRTSEPQPSSKGTEQTTTVQNEPGCANLVAEPEVLVVAANTPVADVARFTGFKLDSRGWSELAQIIEWEMSVELHGDEAPGDGYRRINLHTDDQIADLALIRYGNADWTIEFDRRGDSRLPIDLVSKLGDDLHHAVWLVKQLNGVLAR
jgi:hypothetical protein